MQAIAYAYEVKAEPPITKGEDRIALKSTVAALRIHRPGAFELAPNHTVTFEFRGHVVRVHRQQVSAQRAHAGRVPR